MQTIAYVPWFVIGVSAIVASITDIRDFKVYNKLTFPLFFAGIVFHTVTAGWSGLQHSLAGGLMGLGIMLLPYMLGAMGAGDTKFVAVVGAWLGVWPMLVALLIGCMATGVYALAMLVWQGRLRDIGQHLWLVLRRLTMFGRHLMAEDQLEAVQTTVKRDNRRERLIPFSAMVSIGIFFLLLVALNVVDLNAWSLRK